MPKHIASIQWRSLPSHIEAAVDRACSQWIGTEYQAGQRAPKMAVDCYNLIAGLWDMLYMKPHPTFLPRVTPDSGVHGVKPISVLMRAFRDQYPLQIVRDNIVEPGDGIVTRATFNASGPRRLGHCMMAGSGRLAAIHAPWTAVSFTNLSATLGIVRIYRPLNKYLWT